MKPILIVGGTRPEVVKLSPVIESLEKLGADYLFVWSGQHYDYELSRIFFEQFRVADPDEDLRVGSGTHAEQMARIMVGLEKLIGKHSPAVVVAEGDTNTVAASSLTSLKCLTPFAHVEAGLRSWNLTMPEEVNRKIAGAIATMHFAPTRLAVINLLFEGAHPAGIFLTGNTIVDVIRKHEKAVRERGEQLLSELDLDKNGYVLVTLHRAENQKDPQRLESILVALERLSRRYDVVFPIHPGTRSRAKELGLTKHLRGLKVMDPLGYFEFLGLLVNCGAVLTDSGGVQEEAFTLKVPAATVRYNTERPETTRHGLNKLVGAETDLIVKTVSRQVEYAEKAKKLRIDNPFGDGRAGERIAQLLKEAAEKGVAVLEPDFRDTPTIAYALFDRRSKVKNILEPVIGFTKSGEPDPSIKNYWKVLARIKKKSDT